MCGSVSNTDPDPQHLWYMTIFSSLLQASGCQHEALLGVLRRPKVILTEVT